MLLSLSGRACVLSARCACVERGFLLSLSPFSSLGKPLSHSPSMGFSPPTFPSRQVRKKDVNAFWIARDSKLAMGHNKFLSWTVRNSKKSHGHEQCTWLKNKDCDSHRTGRREKESPGRMGRRKEQYRKNFPPGKRAEGKGLRWRAEEEEEERGGDQKFNFKWKQWMIFFPDRFLQQAKKN